ncbi:MAG: alpha/beta hydrolase [Sedimenticola sp.]
MPGHTPFIKTVQHREIAYQHLDGIRPGVVFLGGFMSDMTGTKALALESWCRERGREFTRFDYSGHGRSSGAFESGSIGTWLEDALAVFDQVTTGPQLLVGSSMGGWISLLLALKRASRVSGVVTIACATDFTERLLRPALSGAQLESLGQNGYAELPSSYSEQPYRIGENLLSDGHRHLLLGAPIPIHCPVRMLHGLDDEDVPWRISEETLQQLKSDNKELILIENGDHRLSKPRELDRVFGSVAELLDQAASGIT